jgi:uncharacterized membrane protein YhaH (DUF805 family)
VNIGPAELIIVLLFFLFIGVAIYGAIKAGQNGDGGWAAGIIIGFFVGLGWLVALIYLLAVAPRRTHAVSDHGVQGTDPNR